ncbi:MAG: amidase [Sphingomonadales bacterium]|nr:amidase [Sphingomonadales bacterium]
MRRLSLVTFLAVFVTQPAYAKTTAEPPSPPGAPKDADAARAAASSQIELIRQLDDDPAGPRLNAVIVVNPDAPDQAARLARTGRLRGRTVLVKDNIETREFPTTAGSLALADNRTGRDAPLVARLRGDGGVILGKTNLSEWANIRGSRSSSGWSAVGGQTRNPHAIDRSPCGSSSGSGAAIAAGMAWGAIGTETDGSITCPASANGIVGFKPTVGLVSRTYVIPISVSQDTAGPMARNVADAALLLTAIAGSDPADPATAEADARKTDFAAGLPTASLKGVRIGVLRKQIGPHSGVSKLFDHAQADLVSAGAILVPIDYDPPGEMFRDESLVLRFELKEGVNSYLRSLPGTPRVRSLTDIIAFNKATPEELRWFGQDTFEGADLLNDRPAYERARANSLRLAGPEGIDKLLADNKVAFLIAPTEGPAWPIDLVTGDHFLPIGAGSLAAIAGYPHLTVPMGEVEGLPVGLSIIGPKWSDKAVLEAGAAYERARTVPLAKPNFKRWEP